MFAVKDKQLRIISHLLDKPDESNTKKVNKRRNFYVKTWTIIIT